MKKLSIALIAGLFSIANADFLSLSAGAGLWQQNIDGYFKIGNTVNYFGKKSVDPTTDPNTGYLGLKDSTNPYVWAKFIYPIPLLPNIKAQFTKYDSTGHSDYIAGNVKIFGDVSINTPIVNAKTSQTIKALDLTFFYEIKPIFVDIEAGLGVDIWKGNTKINGYENNTGVAVNINQDWTVILPYLYAHVETMQFFGFSAIANVKWAKAGDNHHYDYSGAIKYTIDIIGPVNPFIKVGYRYKEAFGVDGDNETKLQYKGAFLEVGAKF